MKPWTDKIKAYRALEAEFKREESWILEAKAQFAREAALLKKKEEGIVAESALRPQREAEIHLMRDNFKTRVDAFVKQRQGYVARLQQHQQDLELLKTAKGTLEGIQKQLLLTEFRERAGNFLLVLTSHRFTVESVSFPIREFSTLFLQMKMRRPAEP